MSKVAFLGLGVMGFPMAGHLSKKFDITVYNRSTEKAKKWGNTRSLALASMPSAAEPCQPLRRGTVSNGQQHNGHA